MNHTIKSIIIVVAITSMLVLGINMIPLAQNTHASSHRHQDNIVNQQDDTYRSPGSESSNVAIQESGKGNSATSFSDQSSNIQQQQNQPTSLQQQDPQANKDKDKNFPITLNVLPNQRITNTNVNPNTNIAGSNSSSASDASNDNTIDNTAIARQRQADASCAIALTCPEGTTTVTSPPINPCPHSPYTDFVGGLCQNGVPAPSCTTLAGTTMTSGPDASGNCTGTFPDSSAASQLTCKNAGGIFDNEAHTCTYRATGPATVCPPPEGSTQTPTVVNGRCTIQPGPA
jgi:hypothetical protein